MGVVVVGVLAEDQPQVVGAENDVTAADLVFW
jgi:hypothetical protein